MIWFYLVTFIGAFLTAIFAWLPVVDVLPLGMDEALIIAVTDFKAFMAIFPPFAVIWTAVMWYISFRVILLCLKLFRVIR